MSTNPLKPNVIEVESKKDGLGYRVIGISDQIEKRDLIEWKDLSETFPREMQKILEWQSVLHGILKITSKKGQTVLNKADVPFPELKTKLNADSAQKLTIELNDNDKISGAIHFPDRQQILLQDRKETFCLQYGNDTSIDCSLLKFNVN